MAPPILLLIPGLADEGIFGVLPRNDQFTNADGSIHEVGSYSIFDFTLAWSGVKNLTLLAGVHNIFDTNPPSTNQSFTFQRGYDPRFADPRGRTWIFRAAYKFL